MRKRARRGAVGFRTGPAGVGAAVLALLLGGGVAHAGGGLSGTWHGHYLCGHMPLGIEMTITEDADGKLSAEGRSTRSPYVPMPERAFRMTGSRDLRTGLVALAANEPPPGGYRPPVLRGLYVGHPAGIAGAVRKKDCTTFFLAPGEAPGPGTAQAGAGGAGAAPPSCDRVSAWVHRFDTGPPGTPPGSASGAETLNRIAYLFTDEVFEPAFGKPFDALSEAERKSFQAAFFGCRIQHGMAPILSQPFSVPIGPWGSEGITVAVKGQRVLRAWVKESLAGLERLKGAPTAYARAVAVEAVGEEMLVSLAPDERQAFLDRVASVRASGAEPSLAVRVDAALAAARSGTGAAALEGFETDNAALLAAVSEPVRARELARLSDARRSLLVDALRAGRAEWSGWGHDLAALGQEAAWYAGFRDRNAALLADPGMASLLDDFRARRAATLEGARPELERRLAEADTDGAVDRAMAAYLVDDLDGPLTSARPLYAAAQARRDTLQRERRQAEESSRRQAEEAARLREEERRRTVAAAPSPVAPGAAAAGPSFPASSGVEGPTEREMLAAIEAEIESKNAGIRDVEARCQSREFQRTNDPVLALMCLGTMGANAGKPGLAYRVTGFKRIACASALPVGKAGYLCDYYVSFSSNSPFQSRGMDMLQTGQARARFVRGADGWLLLRD